MFSLHVLLLCLFALNMVLRHPSAIAERCFFLRSRKDIGYGGAPFDIAAYCYCCRCYLSTNYLRVELMKGYGTNAKILHPIVIEPSFQCVFVCREVERK